MTNLSEKRRKKQKIDFKHNLKVYLEFLLKYKWTFIFVAISLLIVEALNVGDKFLFKIIADNGAAYLNKALSFNAYTKILLIVAFVFICIAAGKAVSRWIFTTLNQKLQTDLIFDLKKKYFTHILYLSHSFHTTHRTGSLIARLSRGASAIERISDVIVFNTFPLIFQLIIVCFSFAYLAPSTAIVLLTTAIVFIVYSFIMQHRTRRLNAKLNIREDIEKANIADILTNVESIKYYGKEKNIASRFLRISANTREALLEFWNSFRVLELGQLLIISAGVFFLIYFPVKSFLAGEITIGTLTFVYTVYGSVFGQLFNFMSGVRGYYRSMADFQDLFEYGKIEQEVKDGPGARDLDIKQGEIEFRNVSFKYNIRKFLENFNLKIKPGEKIALVGHSGSGKTTIIKLLYRLYDVQKGDILIDKKNIKEFKQESLRSELSIVPQECILFDDTIYNNILFSRPDATRKEVMNAMRFAQLDKIVSTFPYKENTIVGERGIKLSGGEKQRVSIARAILANQKVIVLDEATSSLDSQTESEIQQDLHRLLEGRTSIIIAHRLSTIMHADRIVVLDKGKIVQIGRHNELINRPGVYKRLWSLQKGGYLQE